jgi:hypothetical protein
MLCFAIPSSTVQRLVKPVPFKLTEQHIFFQKQNHSFLHPILLAYRFFVGKCIYSTLITQLLYDTLHTHR